MLKRRVELEISLLLIKQKSRIEGKSIVEISKFEEDRNNVNLSQSRLEVKSAERRFRDYISSSCFSLLDSRSCTRAHIPTRSRIENRPSSWNDSC